MAVTRVQLETIGDITEDPTDGSFSGSVSYLVTTNNLNTTGAQIRNASAGSPAVSIPAIEDAHPLEASALCRSRSIEAIGNDYKWRVNCDYDSNTGGFEDPNVDPQQLTVRGSQKAFSEQRPTVVDAYGAPTVNTAGDYYAGLARRVQLREYVCTSSFFSIPDFLFQLAGTVNSTWVTIHGRSYPPGTCLMGDVSHPDTPGTWKKNEGTSLEEDVPYWVVTYSIKIDPDGWVAVLPNRGANALYFETRMTTDDKWHDRGFDTYDAQDDEDLRRVRKGRILDYYDSELSDNIWLDQNGEKELVTLTPLSTTGSMVEGKSTLTASNFTEQMLGTYITVAGAGFQGRPLKGRIIKYNSTSSVKLSAPASLTVRNVSVTGGAARVNVFQLDDLADWSAVPTPNNHD